MLPIKGAAFGGGIGFFVGGPIGIGVGTFLGASIGKVVHFIITKDAQW